jgi:predicted GNAT family acetyltransferase
MRVVRTDDATAFMDLAGPLLRRDEARNNLILGVVATILEDPKAYEQHDGWVAMDREPVAAAAWTPPRDLLLGDPADPAAIPLLARAIAEDVPALPGITANQPALDAFVRAWVEQTGATARVTSQLTVYALETVAQIVRAPGSARPASRADRDIVVAWMRDFVLEAPRPDELVANELQRFLEGRLEAADAGYRLWIDGGRPVSLAGFMGPTGTGIRVGPVYTPPEHRHAGYARTLLAVLAEELLGRGYRACYLASDVDNAPATALYLSVGYRPVADAAMVAFEAA